MSFKRGHLDRGFLGVCIAILCFGILTLSGISASYSLKNFGNPNYYLFHQLEWGILPGLILGYLAYRASLNRLKSFSWLFLAIGCVLMILVFVPGIGIKEGGALRWVDFKFVSFQPSEFFKLFFLIYVSSWLAKKKTGTLFPFLAILGLVAVLLGLQKDLGTLSVIVAFALVCFFSAKTSLKDNLILFSLSLALGLGMIKLSSYRMERVKVWLDFLFKRTHSDQSLSGIRYQIEKAVVSIGSGGIFGLGFGKGDAQTIPHPMSDSIFAQIGQETGFLGCLILVSLFIFFLWRGIKIAKNSQDDFLRIFSVGFSSWIFIQAFVNMAALTEIVPLTGIPLPFISYGGSHVIAEMIGIGIMLNISKEIKR